MNIDLLTKVAARISIHPETFRMGAYITEIGSQTCGCIAAHAISEGENKSIETVSREADHTPEGYESKRATELLELTNEQARSLFHLQMWPVEFRALYRKNKASAANGRIAWFIVTKGVE